jgi:hypothetical protein
MRGGVGWNSDFDGYESDLVDQNKAATGQEYCGEDGWHGGQEVQELLGLYKAGCATGGN